MQAATDPKQTQNRLLTETKIRSARASTNKPLKLAEPGGLFLLVTPGGAKLWRFRFRLHGKEGLLALGAYPDVTLAKARELQRTAKSELAAGVNPVHARARRDAEAAINTFNSLTTSWQARADADVRENTRKQRHREITKYLLPKLGTQRVSEITRPQLTALLTSVESGGTTSNKKKPAPQTARNLRTHLNAIFEYAIDVGVASTNPTPPRRLLKPRRSVHHAALPQAKIGQFLNTIHSSGIEPKTRIAMLLLMLTASRKNEVTSACWTEFDLEKRAWVIPAQRMKAARDHWVPLSSQSMKLLEELRGIVPHGCKHLFPNKRDAKKPMSDRSLNAAMSRLGFDKIATPHGMRAVFSTHFNSIGANPEVIERCLAHAPLDKVRAAYNRHEYQAERRTMLEAWATHLESLQNAGRVTEARG